MAEFILEDILKDSKYALSQFSQELQDRLEENIFPKEVRGKKQPYINCLKRQKDIQLKPEEIIHQLYLMHLHYDLEYPLNRIEVEKTIHFGREKKRADIAIIDKDDPLSCYIIVEIKAPKHKDGKEQLKSYCNATGAPMAIWTNGEQISYFHRKDPNLFEDLSEIPNVHQKLSDILGERWLLDDLIKKDKLVNENKSLKDLILDMEDEVLANAGVDVF